jgi:hypothetical protein
MDTGRLFFASDLTDRSSGWRAASSPTVFSHPAHPAFSPGNFFADYLDRTVIYQEEVTR